MSTSLNDTNNIPTIVNHSSDWVMRRICELGIVQFMIALVLYLENWSNSEYGPFLSQFTFLNLFLSTLLITYLRFGENWFPCGVRLRRRWGAGWEMTAAYALGFNICICIMYYYLMGNSCFTIQSVVSHGTFPVSIVLCCLTPSYTHWMCCIRYVDILESTFYLFIFMYGNTWFHYLTNSWPYDNGTFPNLATYQDNLLLLCTGACLLFINLIYKYACCCFFINDEQVHTHTQH